MRDSHIDAISDTLDALCKSNAGILTVDLVLAEANRTDSPLRSVRGDYEAARHLIRSHTVTIHMRDLGGDEVAA